MLQPVSSRIEHSQIYIDVQSAPSGAPTIDESRSETSIRHARQSKLPMEHELISSEQTSVISTVVVVVVVTAPLKARLPTSDSSADSTGRTRMFRLESLEALGGRIYHHHQRPCFELLLLSPRITQ